MPTLHLIISASGRSSCQTVFQAGDTLVLLEDGVYLSAELSQPYCLIEVDARARGVLDRATDAARLINYDDLVELVVTHEPVITWS